MDIDKNYLWLLSDMASDRTGRAWRVFSDALGTSPHEWFPKPLKSLAEYLFAAQGKPLGGRLYTDFAAEMELVHSVGELRQLDDDDYLRQAKLVVEAIRRDAALTRHAPYYAQQLHEGVITPSEYWHLMRTLMQRLDAIGTGGMARDPEELEASAIDQLDALARGEVEKIYIPSFIEGLRFVRGLHVFAGPPGIGKSSLVATIALKAARRKYGVAFAELEMSGEKLYHRFAQADTRMNIDDLVAQQVDHRDPRWQSLRSAIGKYRDLPLTILDRPAQTVDDIASFLRNAHHRGTGVNLLVVDYSELVQTNDKEYLYRLDTVTKGLVRIIAENPHPEGEALACLLIMATNRGGGQGYTGPRLSHLKWVGDYVAEQVLMLWRPIEFREEEWFIERYGMMDVGEDSVFLDKVKDRNGPTFGVYWHLIHDRTTRWTVV